MLILLYSVACLKLKVRSTRHSSKPYFICYTVKLISLNFIASNCVAFFFSSCAASVDKTHLAAPFILCASKCVCFRSREGGQDAELRFFPETLPGSHRRAEGLKSINFSITGKVHSLFPNFFYLTTLREVEFLYNMLTIFISAAFSDCQILSSIFV